MKITFFSKSKRIKELENEVEKWKKINAINKNTIKRTEEINDAQFQNIIDSFSQFREMSEMIEGKEDKIINLENQLKELRLKYNDLRNKHFGNKKKQVSKSYNTNLLNKKVSII